jgi:hypothetical protein
LDFIWFSEWTSVISLNIFDWFVVRKTACFYYVVGSELVYSIQMNFKFQTISVTAEWSMMFLQLTYFVLRFLIIFFTSYLQADEYHKISHKCYLPYSCEFVSHCHFSFSCDSEELYASKPLIRFGSVCIIFINWAKRTCTVWNVSLIQPSF